MRSLFIVMPEVSLCNGTVWAELHADSEASTVAGLSESLLAGLGVRDPWPSPATLRALTLGASESAVACADPVALQVGLDDIALSPLAGGIAPCDARELRGPLIEAAAAHGLELVLDDRLQGLLSSAESWSFDVASPAELHGVSLRQAFPRGRDGSRLKRLLTEWQMLLHEHPINALRVERGAAPVGCLWVFGIGAPLPPPPSIALPPLRGRSAELEGLWIWLGGEIAVGDGERFVDGPGAYIVDAGNATRLGELWSSLRTPALTVFADGRLHRRRRRWPWRQR